MKKISNLKMKNKNVLIRVDFNVPLHGKVITNDYRIQKAIKTIKYCLDCDASVTLMSHLGRPSSKNDKIYSLKNLKEHLKNIFQQNIFFFL